jgi:hypothetical protein
MHTQHVYPVLKHRAWSIMAFVCAGATMLSMASFDIAATLNLPCESPFVSIVRPAIGILFAAAALLFFLSLIRGILMRSHLIIWSTAGTAVGMFVLLWASVEYTFGYCLVEVALPGCLLGCAK